MDDSMKSRADKGLSSITMETELLQSFVRVNVEDDQSQEAIDDKQQQKEKSLGVHISTESEPKSKQTVPVETSRKLSKQLATKQPKKSRRRRHKYAIRHEEVYCDKDRAAAVNLGTKDIKQSLKLKRKQDRSRMMMIPEDAEPGNFLALGQYEMCRGDLRIACEFMSKAVELNPTDKNALVARSRCHILLGQPKKALEDAELALQIDKKFIKAIYQKAEALYYLGDFELSLMFYHRGLHVRPDHEGFKLGVHKAQKAIENAVGLISSLKEANISSTTTTARSEGTNGTPESKNNDSSKTSNKTTARTNLTKPARKPKLLRQLEVDKKYLDSLMHNPDIKCKYKENDHNVENCIKETVEFLNERQEFWRQQMPPSFK